MRALVWLLGICTILLLGVWVFRHDARRLLLSDNVMLQTRGGVNRGDVRICWTGEMTTDTVVIYSAGREVEHVPEATGQATFLIYYKGMMVGEFGHFRTGVIAPHTYVFQLWEQGDSLYSDLKISGPDANL